MEWAGSHEVKCFLSWGAVHHVIARDPTVVKGVIGVKPWSPRRFRVPDAATMQLKKAFTARDMAFGSGTSPRQRISVRMKEYAIWPFQGELTKLPTPDRKI